MKDSIRIKHRETPSDRKELDRFHAAAAAQCLRSRGDEASLHVPGLEGPQLELSAPLRLPSDIEVKEHGQAPPVAGCVVDVLLEPGERRVEGEHGVAVLADVGEAGDTARKHVHDERVHLWNRDDTTTIAVTTTVITTTITQLPSSSSSSLSLPPSRWH